MYEDQEKDSIAVEIKYLRNDINRVEENVKELRGDIKEVSNKLNDLALTMTTRQTKLEQTVKLVSGGISIVTSWLGTWLFSKLGK